MSPHFQTALTLKGKAGGSVVAVFQSTLQLRLSRMSGLGALRGEDTLGSTTDLVTHIRQFHDDDWDEEVRERTRMCLLDSLACYSAGLSLPHFAQSAAGAINSLGGIDPTVDPSPFVLAYLYGQAANALDFDDTLNSHPGAPIIGAVLAVAAAHNLSTDQLLRGIACGYEASWVLNAAANPSPEKGSLVRGVGVWDTVAASIGAAFSLGLDDTGVQRVIGVATAHSILPYTAKWYERPVPAIKNNMGWIAAGAVLSINSALAGQTGVTNPLDGDTGMWQMAGSDRWSLTEELLRMKPAVLRVGFKRFPGCWHTQAPLKTLGELLEKVKLDDDVTDIVVAGPADVAKFCDEHPSGMADIAFSLPALFWQLISGVEPGPHWESFDQTEPNFKFSYEKSNSRTITLRTRKGQVHSAPIEAGHGTDLSGVGLDPSEVIAKFERFAPPALGAELRSLVDSDYSSVRDEAPVALYRSIRYSMMQISENISSAVLT